MRKILACAIAVMITILPILSSHAETLIYYGGIDKNNEGYTSFVNSHSNVDLKQVEKYYQTESEFTGALLTGEFKCDLFELDTSSYDWSAIMEKQYCIDLSNSIVISDAMKQMHPSIAQLGIRDGHIFAVPFEISFRYIRINEEAWEKCELTDEDIPQSFPQLLDFLDHWCDRLESGDVPSDIRIVNSWVSELYDEASYTQWLTSQLVDQYIMYANFSGTALDFSDANLSVLLERCRQTGKRIYTLEPAINSYSNGNTTGLFTQDAQSMWPQSASQIVSLRLDESKPKVINAVVSMYAISSSAENIPLALDLLEKLVVGPESPLQWDHAFLYQNAEPKINNNYQRSIDTDTQQISILESQLSNPNLGSIERVDLENELAEWQSILAADESDEYKYYVTPAQLADYQEYVDTLFFPAPSVFNAASSGYEMVTEIESKFSWGVISSVQLLQELNRISHMLYLENN